MSDNKLLHVAVCDYKSNGRGSQSEDEEGQDKECGLLARLLSWLRNSEGIDEGVGEKVDEAHNCIMPRSWRLRISESLPQGEHLFW